MSAPHLCSTVPRQSSWSNNEQHKQDNLFRKKSPKDFLSEGTDFYIQPGTENKQSNLTKRPFNSLDGAVSMATHPAAAATALQSEASSRQSEQAASRTTAARNEVLRGEKLQQEGEKVLSVLGIQTPGGKKEPPGLKVEKRREISRAASARCYFDAFRDNMWRLAGIESRILCQPEDGRTKVTPQGWIQETSEFR